MTHILSLPGQGFSWLLLQLQLLNLRLKPVSSPSHITSTALIPLSRHKVDLATVPTPQLTQIKNQLTQELSELTNSFAQLRAAQAKFRDCITCIRDGVAEKQPGSWASLYYYYT